MQEYRVLIPIAGVVAVCLLGALFILLTPVRKDEQSGSPSSKQPRS